jgi:Arc/MetJ-type ribon-helix-helix transcriptional regulator
MNVDLPLEPQKQAKLDALAHAKGLSADEFIREAVEKILDEAPDQHPAPKKSLYGLLAKYGEGPSEEEIDENRREMFRGFAEYHP